MNHVVLMGRLTKDPMVTYSAGENPVCVARFKIAVDRRFKKAGEEQTADFIDCIAFGKQGEFVEKYLRKGIKMVVSGRIQTGSYTNKDGNKIYTTDVVVENLEFAEKKQSGGDFDGPIHVEASADGFMNIPTSVEGEIPFK